MKLRTEISIPPLRAQIGYGDQIFTIGSCFAQRIGDEMKRAKFNVTTNPVGTLFNPLSICDAIERLSECRLLESAEELQEGDMGWYHYDFHSSFTGATDGETMSGINRAIVEGGEALRHSNFVVVTLGTAWVYALRESGKVVANCHKEPARNFVRRRASVGEIVGRLTEVIERHLVGRQVILTLSPIRHISDGLAENSLSKATLRVAIDEIVAALPDQVSYFPSYEIVMDDLRDYRFYDSDMVHPSAVAVEYIWDSFCNSALSARAKELLAKVLKVVRAAEHRPFNPSSAAYRNHCEAQIRAIEAIEGVDMSEEYRYFGEQLKINL